jgi:hypothetical protein
VKVTYYGRCEGGYGNIYWHWRDARPMRNGKFPSSHPCHANPKPTVWNRADQPVSDDPLGRLRARDYMASCFPEGDGIAFDPPAGRTHEQIIADIVECFGFDVRVERA